jgi:Spy/CpxP family protein refolding chaperone
MKYNAGKWIMAIVALGVLALAFNAYAGRGQGPRGQGYGDCPRGAWGYLSEEQLEKAQTERQTFQSATAELRSLIYEKQTELAAVLAKQEVDVEKARSLQKDLSALESQFDEKQLEHALKMKEISPELASGFMARGGGGYHHGKMRCGDCPYGMGPKSQQETR